jgi:hypothetical protein
VPVPGRPPMALGVRRNDTTADNGCRQRILREVFALRVVYAT